MININYIDLYCFDVITVPGFCVTHFVFICKILFQTAIKMMCLKVVLALLGLFKATAQLEWMGSFSNWALGGEKIHVCVTELGNEYIAQGMISQRSYMRGIAYPNGSWIGQYWKAGGNEKGSFNIRLIDGGSSLATFSGTFYLYNSLKYTDVYGTQLTFVQPNSVDCCAVDNTFLMSELKLSPYGIWNSSEELWSITDRLASNLQLEATYELRSGLTQYANGSSTGNLDIKHGIYAFNW